MRQQQVLSTVILDGPKKKYGLIAHSRKCHLIELSMALSRYYLRLCVRFQGQSGDT